MHFDFESTFNHIKNTWLDQPKRIATAILILNAIAFFTMCGLYATNLFLPPVYGSKPNARTWILAFELAGLLWVVTTAHAITLLLIRLPFLRNAFSKMEKSAKGFRNTLNESARIGAIQLYLVLTIMRRVYQYKHLLIPQTGNA